MTNVKRSNPLSEYLENTGLTQKELAENLSVSFMTLSRLLHGRNLNIRADLIRRIHEVCGISYDELLEYFG